MASTEKRRASGDLRAAEDDDITPKPPELIANIEWLRRHWMKHRLVVASALIVVFVGWLLSTSWGLGALTGITNTLVKVKIERTVGDLRLRYAQARDSLAHGYGDFGAVENDINAILEIDPRNGHGLYYAGEVKRIKTPSLFTAKSCVIAERLASSPQSLDSYQNDFNRYLDIEKAQPDGQRSGNYSAETCYVRPLGFCPQRTAWVHHLLANDLYAEAMLVANSNARAEMLDRAIKHAQAAADLYKDESNRPGFRQCMETTVLINEAKKALASLR